MKKAESTVGTYDSSQLFIFAAEAYSNLEEWEQARSCWCRAAEVEEGFARSLGEDKPRTKSVFLASAAWCYHAGGDCARARSIVEEFLSAPWLKVEGRLKLKALKEILDCRQQSAN